MFLSNVFADCFVNTLNTRLELHNCHGSFGAAIGAGIGAGIYTNEKEAFTSQQPLAVKEMTKQKVHIYNELYENWKLELQKQL